MDYGNDKISEIVPNSAQPGLSPIVRNKDYAMIAENKIFPNLKTVYDVFMRAVQESPNERYLGHRQYDPTTKQYGKYEFETYSQVHDRATNFGSGLMQVIMEIAKNNPNIADRQKSLDLVTKRKWPVALYASNCPEWTITDKACTMQSLYSVALYDTLGGSSMEYILNHTEAPVVVCSIDKISKLLESVDNTPHVKAIISIHSLDEKENAKLPDHLQLSQSSIGVLREWAKSKNIYLNDFSSIEQIGIQMPIPHHPPQKNDIYIILYTSGTTGNPKGAVTTHSNYTYYAKVTYAVRNVYKNTPSMFSYLPLAHTYGRSVETYIVLMKGYIGYYTGDVSRVLDDITELNPTIFNGVPRLLQRYYNILAPKTINAPGIIGEISRRGFREKVENMRAGKGFEHPLWDALVFNKTKAFLSKNLEYITTGSAPLEPHVVDFLRVAFGTRVIDCYGTTETSSGGTCQQIDDLTSGNCGVPHPGMELRLRDVPEMEYTVKDTPNPRGELLVRGPTMFREYYKDKEKTDEALIGDGWYATGDIARINSNGSFSIIDRKKAIFKLSQGEYVAPEKIENVYSKHELVLQSFVHGYSVKDYTVGIIVPDQETFVPWARNIVKQESGNGALIGFEDLAKNENVKKRLLKELDSFGRKSGLNGFEIVKAIHIETEPFDVETNSLLTPTFKLKRFDAAKYYKKVIDSLYTK
ncbi:hypothetical protein BB558_000813 [Smittium angustum]|uniref:AMP-dependent synthetase/ligase domain-containing protein n=1 Tax=Smittium angustum TaxID=133377 RepID=A0A2U1JD53_SMIAN|nr:hypothetical protein BB558_000813 [Smittium angustum]